MSEEATSKANLAMTAQDHRAIGSTPPLALKDNPHSTLAETMTDEALRAFVQNEVAAAAEMYAEAAQGDARMITSCVAIRDGVLGRNFGYLRDIGRLPPEFADFDPRLRFALPKKRRSKR